jgi:hypothetical protein
MKIPREIFGESVQELVVGVWLVEDSQRGIKESIGRGGSHQLASRRLLVYAVDLVCKHQVQYMMY